MEVKKLINVQPSYECEQCGKKFSQTSSRNRHIREQHLHPGSYECKNCGIRFSKKFNLQMHLKHAHFKDFKKDATVFKCSYCTCMFTKNYVLKKHIKIYHEKERQQEIASTNQENPNDPQTIAANVILELKQLQNDILPKSQEQILAENIPCSSSTQELFAIDSAIVEDIIIKDKLYPLGHFMQHKVQIIKRSDGFSYYVCKFCSKEFKKSYDYLRHRRIHTKVRPFICVFCKKSFPTVAQLKTHCKTHKLHEKFGIFKRFYKCPKCEEGFASITQLDTHISSHLQTDIIFECPECLKSFQTLKSLFHHKHYTDDKEFDLLKSLLPAPLSLVEETKSRANILNKSLHRFSCTFCNFKLSSKITLKQHERRHQNLYKYQCSRCKICFVSQSSLNVHKKIHRNQNNLKCQQCSKNFHNNYQLHRHHLTHSKTHNYKCQYCDKTFKTSQNCRSHMMTHLKQLIKTNEGNEGNEEQIEIFKNYTTIIQDFNNKDILATNTQILRTARKSLTKHNNEQHNLEYSCLKCNKSFRYAAWLRKHFKYKHTNEKPYECEICLKTYRTKQILENHNLIHSETKPKFFCQVCGKQYASKKSLKVHLRIHTEEKPFKCVICTTKFRTSGHLIQHRKSNHKEH